MLQQLSIHQFIIIDELTLDFSRGLTVLTGETGAGKSILLDALGIILGDEGEVDMIRAGSGEARVTARIAPRPDHPVWKILADKNIHRDSNGHEDSRAQEISIERLLTREGANEIRVNGDTLDLETLKSIGDVLVEIHGQFANQSITDPVKQLQMLDLSGGYREILKATTKAWYDMKALERELDDERKFMANTASEREFLGKAVAELRSFKAQPGEYEKLDEQYNEQVRVKTISDMLQSVQSQLVAGTGAQRMLIGAGKILDGHKTKDPETLSKLDSFLMQALDATRMAVEELYILMPKFEVDVEGMTKADTRLKKFRELAAQHKVEPHTLPETFVDCTQRLDRILKAPERIKKLEDTLMETKGVYSRHAHALSSARKAAAKELSASITAEMAPLRLPNAQFVVSVKDLTSAEWGPLGMNTVEFTARTNPGMPFSTIAKTASGGELARMILAVKVILQKVQPTCTLIFDEVDTGIGGPSAAAVGERLAKLSDATQVLVITHSPQVASRGEQHLQVLKSTDGETTRTTVKVLDTETRSNEIARMLSGDEITTEAAAAARSLINEAVKARDARRAVS
jgi:DNA repair protein RecN (Recombination protein N)